MARCLPCRGRTRRIVEAIELLVGNARHAKIVDDVKRTSGAAKALRTYATPRNRADEENLSGHTVAQVPAHQWSLGVTKRWPGRVTTTLWYDHSGDYFVDGLNTFKSGAYGLLNASVQLQPSRVPRLEVQLTGTNLTNERYYYFVGTSRMPTEAFPGSPFQLSATIKLRLTR